MNEIWKDIPGFEGLYQISNMGRVKSLGRVFSNSRWKNRVCKPRILKGISKHGYLYVVLCDHFHQKTSTQVHRLVASAFVPNNSNLPFVNHIDENPGNNRADNLEWCNAEYNANYGTRNRRIAKEAMNASHCSKPVGQYTLDGTLLCKFVSAAEAERQTGIYRGTICRVCKGKAKSAGNFYWKYTT